MLFSLQPKKISQEIRSFIYAKDMEEEEKPEKMKTKKNCRRMKTNKNMKKMETKKDNKKIKIEF